MKQTDKRCPLCQAKHDCQVKQAELCWCRTYHFPSALLAQLQAYPNRCICVDCAERLGARQTGDLST